MNEEEFINELKRSNVILVDELHKLYISRQKHQETVANREHIYLVNLECAREGTRKQVLNEVGEAVNSGFGLNANILRKHILETLNIK